jgi:hypothetical protein
LGDKYAGLPRQSRRAVARTLMAIPIAPSIIGGWTVFQNWRQVA